MDLIAIELNIFLIAISLAVIYAIAPITYKLLVIHNNISFETYLLLSTFILFLCSLFFLNGTSVLMSSDMVLMKITEEFMSQQAGLPVGLNLAIMLKVIKAASIFLLITGLIGLMHIRTTLRLVKEYNYLFE
jgi:hypothetical protein